MFCFCELRRKEINFDEAMFLLIDHTSVTNIRLEVNYDE